MYLIKFMFYGIKRVPLFYQIVSVSILQILFEIIIHILNEVQTLGARN